MATQAHHQALLVRPRLGASTALDDRRLPGILLFILAAQFMTVIMLAASIAPGYDFNAAAISDLGVIQETALLFNVSLVAVGLLNIVGGYLFYRSHRRLWIVTVFAVAGVGAAGAGVFPLDSSELHSLFALVAFLFFNLQAIASGTLLVGPMKLVSLLAGIVGICFVLLMIVGDAGNASAFGAIGHGGAERMIVYPVMIWMLAFGGYLMAARRRADDSNASGQTFAGGGSLDPDAEPPARRPGSPDR